MFRWVLSAALIATPMIVRAQTSDAHVVTAVQDALAWTGHYNLLHDGSIGQRTVAAVSEFQRQQGWPATGNLDERQIVRLFEFAQGQRTRFGFREVTDQRSQMTIGLPVNLVGFHSDTPNGSRYRSRDGQIEIRLVRHDAREKSLRALYQEVRDAYAPGARQLDRYYEDRFFVRGFDDRRVFYYSARQLGNELKGFTFSYPTERERELGPVIVAMGNSFKAPIIDYPAVVRLMSPATARAPAVAGCELRAGFEYFRVPERVTDGVLNLRHGPGTSFPIIVSMPGGSCGIRWLGQCDSPAGSAAPWCRVEWSGHIGWASMTGLVKDQAATGTAPQAPSMPDLAQASCEDLWTRRNAIYKAAGYCFQGERAIRHFGNGGCRFTQETDLPIDAAGRERIAAIRRIEALKACTADGGQQQAATTAPSKPSVSPPSAARKEPELNISYGTGIVVDRNGHILSNDHVVGECSVVAVVGHGPAQVVRRDPANDLAIIKVKASPDLRPARFSSEDASLADRIYVFGYPLADTLSSTLKVTDGLVSSLAGIRDDSRFLQISAAVQPGNSGGPLVDQSGRVVGVVTLKLNTLNQLRRSGTIPENVSFALRGSMASTVLRASGVQPALSGSASPMPTSAIAAEAQGYTVQIYCASGGKEK